ncbi:hypothetical protein CEQ90_16975 [Lewinellaceae bacterium SD302]|nr:hypothetical protein CEQ90_16975 [Lewinellaceae bacterium SD302]
MKSPYLSIARICNGRANWQKSILSLCLTLLLGSLSAQFTCPNTGTVTFDPVGICEGGSFETCSVSGVENLGFDDNGETTFRLDFFFFEEQTDDPYAGGGEFAGLLNNSSLVDGTVTFPTVNFSTDVNRPGFIYTILNPAPADPNCRPFAEFEILVTDLVVESKFAGTVCEDFTQGVVPAALTPTGGVYSGPGITDLGDGISYAFDASVNGPGTLLVNYTVTVDGCSGVGFDTIEIVALPEVGFVAEVDTVSVANGVQTGLGGGFPTGGFYSGTGVNDDGNGTTFTFDPAAAGVGVFNVTYTITGDVFPNCSNQAIDSIEVVQVSSVTNFTQADLRVYPNPTSGILAIKVAKPVGNTMHYELTDLRGRLITSGRIDTSETQIDLEAEVPGVYFLRVLDAHSGNWLVKKVVRQ